MPILRAQVLSLDSKHYGRLADVGGGGKMMAAQALGHLHKN
jgi:hypothetical protein